ncbi:hypothetical protein HPB47_005831 [Ixodes persulcatus]|uniref:Uncharacterized protein n=1 Tax=Ixodes persulcatus TaxID=34615 RepID=A0AC60PBW7_IXOPE|nr:hypothetical protein HPB47_005831 [Ixodes persulcatus]
MSDSRFSLQNDTALPTRVGNSVEHDTNPDLTWYRGNPAASWENSLETLGSDHCILVTTLTFARARSTPNRGPRITTPGMDKITYAMLRNLPETYLDSLLQHINEAWDAGILPQEWKEALVISIPKPDKTPDNITNLRPISLTSCTDDHIIIHEHAQHQRLITSQQGRQILAREQYDTSRLPPLPTQPTLGLAPTDNRFPHSTEQVS